MGPRVEAVAAEGYGSGAPRGADGGVAEQVREFQLGLVAWMTLRMSAGRSDQSTTRAGGSTIGGNGDSVLETGAIGKVIIRSRHGAQEDYVCCRHWWRPLAIISL